MKRACQACDEHLGTTSCSKSLDDGTILLQSVFFFLTQAEKVNTPTIS